MSLEDHIAVVDSNFSAGFERRDVHRQLNRLGVDWDRPVNPNQLHEGSPVNVWLYPPKFFLMWTPQAAQLRFDREDRLSEVWLEIPSLPEGDMGLLDRASIAGSMANESSTDGLLVEDGRVRMIRLQPLQARLSTQLASEGRR